MTPEEDYAEALRRIREAERIKAVELDLSGMELLPNRLILEGEILHAYLYSLLGPHAER